MQLFQPIHLKSVSDGPAASNSHFFPIQLDISPIAKPKIRHKAELQKHESERQENHQNCAYLNHTITNKYKE